MLLIKSVYTLTNAKAYTFQTLKQPHNTSMCVSSRVLSMAKGCLSLLFRGGDWTLYNVLSFAEIIMLLFSLYAPNEKAALPHM